tara:strand:+ start:635 stop:1531 length:897 start_codon:yes stop_codon:yes gene_type:complete
MAFNLGFRGKVGGVTLGANIPLGIGRDKEALQTKNKMPKPTETPGNNVTRMLSNIRQSNLFSRPYLYRIMISPPPALLANYSSAEIQHILLNCETVNMPGYTMATKEHKTYGLKREYVYEKLNNGVTLGFYMSDQMFEFNFFKDWLDYINPNDEGRIRYYDEYKSTITIYQLSRMEADTDEDDLRVMQQCKLVDAYPKSLSDLQLGHGTGGSIQKMTTEIMFRKAVYTDYTKKSQQARSLGTRSSSFGSLNGLKEFGTRGLENALSSGLGLKKFTDIIKQEKAALPAQTIEQWKENNW